MSLEKGEKIYGKFVAVFTIPDDVIKRVETLRKTQQQPFRAPQMLQYEWRPGHAAAADDVNLDVPNKNENQLVTDPVKQQQIVQDPNPFAILANDEDIKNEDDEAQQVLPDHIENQGAEYAINAKKSNWTRKTKERLIKFKERENITEIKERGSRLKMYSRKTNRTTNQTATRKNLIRERKIASKYLPI